MVRTAGDRWQAFMDAAADCVQLTAREEVGEDAECARRILQTPASWSLWEKELGTALRPVASCRTRSHQIRALRQANFTWVHRAAPFRHLRRHNLRGAERKRLIMALHGPFAHYDLAVVAEHENYQRSVCHEFCADHLGEIVLHDPLYSDSMRRYQALYMEYFEAFSELTCAGPGTVNRATQRLLPLMKHELEQMRHTILDYPQRKVWLRRQSTIRAPRGDTQILGQLDLILS